jgi:sulfur transfer complex TusBCD TusB component (DsrH family)
MDDQNPSTPAKFGCPKEVVYTVLEDARGVNSLASYLIREKSGKKYDSLWTNYYSSVTLLCEHYATSTNLTQLLKSIVDADEIEVLEDGIECYVLTPVDIKLISQLMLSMYACEEELLLHNISFELH